MQEILLAKNQDIDPMALRRLPTTIRYMDSKGAVLDELDERKIQAQGVPYYYVRFHYTTYGDRAPGAKQYLYFQKHQRQLVLKMVPPTGEFAKIPGYPFIVSRIWNYGEPQI